MARSSAIGWAVSIPLRTFLTSTDWACTRATTFSPLPAPPFAPVRALAVPSHSPPKGKSARCKSAKGKRRPVGAPNGRGKGAFARSIHEDPWKRLGALHTAALPNSRSADTRSMGTTLKVAVVGCAHGELESLYTAISETEQAGGIKVDVVICAGDFQAVRNEFDLQSLACPPKYRDMRSFWKYYAGHLVAPVPTIFIGGNHEASNHLQEIPLGGLVAPNIYFLGYAGVVNFRGLRIAGVSGTYVDHAYLRKRTERPPYTGPAARSVYHLREEDVRRVLRLRRRNDIDADDGTACKPIDIVLSHDWPKGITDYGNVEQLLRAKPFLATEIAQGSFGNAPMTQVLHTLQPKYWFSAHMHVKFAAVVKHESAHDAPDGVEEVNEGKKEKNNMTRFLALDKIVPRRDFLQILDIPVDVEESAVDSDVSEDGECHLSHDLEWLTILRTEVDDGSRTSNVTKEEMDKTRDILKSHGISMTVRMKSDFERAAEVYSLSSRKSQFPKREYPAFRLQHQNVRLFAALGVSAPPDYVLLTCRDVESNAGVAGVSAETGAQSAETTAGEGCTTGSTVTS